MDLDLDFATFIAVDCVKSVAATLRLGSIVADDMNRIGSA